MVLIGIQTVILLLWYFLFNNPQNNELKEIENQVNLTFAKLKSAQKAQLDLSSIQQRLTQEQMDLENVRSKFLRKNELEKATSRTDALAKKYKLTLKEFSPVLENYLASSDASQMIKGYPLVITVEGRYIDIGKFIDGWNDLPFYMIPEEIKLKRLDEKSNDLRAMISGVLYAFNK